MTKKVDLFCLMPKNVVELQDLESHGLEDFDDFDIDKLNESIENIKKDKQQHLKRNTMSFNINQNNWTYFEDSLYESFDNTNFKQFL